MVIGVNIPGDVSGGFNKGVQATPFSGTMTASITTAAITKIKATGGSVGTIINAGATTSGTITVYDNTTNSGKIIWSGTLLAGQILQLGIPLAIGLTVVTAAANTILVSYA